ncbi:MAG: hypothetical protein TREMPRED_002700 [Tremellales sp. Tagirdzhanova-0007]|nr:MAG: hypothetical protein TREMPRED_002700 [Tremellales sp. Tagirdzhanova-0007]
MPSDLLEFPFTPIYTIVGIYRLLTDPLIRGPVLDKVKHASLRGFVVSAVYAVGSWNLLGWFVRRYLVGGAGWFGMTMGRTRAKVGEAVKESAGGNVRVGSSGFGFDVNLVLCKWFFRYTHLLILVPQLSSILRFFIYKNLRIARSKAYALTVSSRGKPIEFWSQGYVEEFANPPHPAPGEMSSDGKHRRVESKWLSWLLWWPTQLLLRHYVLLPLSPSLPLLAPMLTSSLRSLTFAEYLHQPYFVAKRMTPGEVWLWVEERRWAYRAFGFAASLLEGIPIVGLFFSISNRIGAAMWAHDCEKRQHAVKQGGLQTAELMDMAKQE